MLLPVRDGQDTLLACLGSLFSQTFADHEVVAVDDGSSDATPAILAAAAESDARLRVVRTPPRGLVAALNTGLAHVRGALVARMDADDVCHRDRLALQVEGLEDDPRCAILGCGVDAGDAAGGMKRNSTP